MEAAAELMYSNGIERTTLDEVLSHCGAGKSQLYHYFANKQDLVRAVIQLQLDRVLRSQPGLETLHSWKDFDAWGAELVARHSTPAGPLACRLGTFAGEVDPDPQLRGILEQAFRVWEDRLCDGLERLKDHGELIVAADTRELASAVMAAVQGGILLSRLRRDPAPLKAAMAMALLHLRQFRSDAGRPARS